MPKLQKAKTRSETCLRATKVLQAVALRRCIVVPNDGDAFVAARGDDHVAMATSEMPNFPRSRIRRTTPMTAAAWTALPRPPNATTAAGDEASLVAEGARTVGDIAAIVAGVAGATIVEIDGGGIVAAEIEIGRFLNPDRVQRAAEALSVVGDERTRPIGDEEIGVAGIATATRKATPTKTN